MEPGISTDGDKARSVLNEIFTKKNIVIEPHKPLSFSALEAALQYLCKGTKHLLDFACGNGLLSLRAAVLGVEEVQGIDISDTEIHTAKKSASAAGVGAKCKFINAETAYLKQYKNAYFDAVILSDILDYLFPEDAAVLFAEICRIMSPQGKILLKVRSAHSNKYLATIGYSQLDDDVFEAPGGGIYWRLSDAAICTLLEQNGMKIFTSTTVDVPEHGKQRLFLITRK